ncbi:MAG: NAD(P)H-quinone oxidoreductase [Gemmatimonadota bacterium]
MRAVVATGAGGVDALRIAERPDPVPGDGDLLARVRATAVNRADLLQRRGLYPPPPGAPEILGLEMAGEVVSAGPGCEGWSPGDRVFALLPGGGYAELAAIPAGMAMRIPDNLSFEEAAAVPEAFLAAYLDLFDLGGLAPGETVLIHAGASGVGTAAIQLAREAGAVPFATAGSPEKVGLCLALGARDAWNYRQGAFAPWVAAETGGRGVDLILDLVGAPFFEQNVRSLAADGKMIVVGLLGGAEAERLDLGLVLSRRLSIVGSALRPLPVDRKVDLTKRFGAFALPRLADGRLRPVVDSVFDWKDAPEAHARMESNANLGKIVLRVAG